MKRLRSCVLTLTVLCGCASSTSSTRERPSQERVHAVNPETGETMRTASVEVASTTVRASPAAVWNALPAAYSAFGIEPTVNDRASGTFGNQSFVRTRKIGDKRVSDYFECGLSTTGQRADEWQIVASVVSKISAAPDGQTRLATMVSGTVHPRDGTSAQSVGCASTGAIENGIKTAVERSASAP